MSYPGKKDEIFNYSEKIYHFIQLFSTRLGIYYSNIFDISKTTKAPL